MQGIKRNFIIFYGFKIDPACSALYFTEIFRLTAQNLAIITRFVLEVGQKSFCVLMFTGCLIKYNLLYNCRFCGNRNRKVFCAPFSDRLYFSPL